MAGDPQPAGSRGSSGGASRARRHFATRRSALPLNARDLPTIVGGDPARLPGRCRRRTQPRRDAARRALRPARLSRPSRSAPCRTGMRIRCTAAARPLAYWADVPYLDPADRRSQDHLGAESASALAGARARLLADGGDRRFYRAFVAQLETGCSANPPLSASTGRACWSWRFASLSWLWALELFAAAGGARGRRHAVDRRSAPGARSPAHPHRAEPVALLQPEHASLR